MLDRIENFFNVFVGDLEHVDDFRRNKNNGFNRRVYINLVLDKHSIFLDEEIKRYI